MAHGHTHGHTHVTQRSLEALLSALFINSALTDPNSRGGLELLPFNRGENRDLEDPSNLLTVTQPLNCRQDRVCLGICL